MVFEPNDSQDDEELKEDSSDDSELVDEDDDGLEDELESTEEVDSAEEI